MLELTGERYVPWDEGPIIHYEHLHRYRFAKEFVKGKKVLDLACGEGYGSFMLSEDADSVIAVDIDDTAIRHASSKYIRGNLEFIKGSMTEMPIKGEGLFDVIVCFEALEHIAGHDELMRQVKRLLKKEGVFIVSTPNKTVYSDEPGYENPFHVKELNFDKFENLLTANFKNILFYGQNVYPSSNIFPLYKGSTISRDFVIKKGNEGFYFLSPENKMARYFIAVVSDCVLEPDRAIGNSHLVDISNTLICYKDEQIGSLEAIIQDMSITTQKIQCALPVLEKVLERLKKESISSDLSVELGELCFKLGMIDSARFFFEKALIVDPDNRDAKTNISLLAGNTSMKSVTSVDSATHSPVSVIIPVFNNVEYTMQCLNALSSNTSYEPYEVIIVDNGSTDETRNFLKCLGGDVKIITNKENLGFAIACNQGANAAEGEYLVFLNNDTIPQKGWLSELVNTTECMERIGVVGSKLLYPDGTVQHAGVVFNKDCKVYHIYRGFHSDHRAVNRMREFGVVTAACMLVRKVLFFEIGGFDEAYRNGCEDIDFCLKVREKGYKVIYNPGSVLYHFESKTPGRKKYERENSELIFKRWGDRIVPDEDKITREDGFRVVYDKRGYINIVYALELIEELKEDGNHEMAIKALEETKEIFDGNPYIPEEERLLVLKELRDCYVHKRKSENVNPC